MATVNTSDAAALKAAVEKYLGEFPGDLICARQLWYEGLGGQGTAKPPDVEAMEAAFGSAPGWAHSVDARYEKFGEQNSWKRAKQK
ncbi:MAG: hypothetical protein LBT12_00375 [Oscillospiraceae bacterium]|jgi:hypothetical protein|nr:hypothetical protein [Oscillospiraceae bacterium]